MSNTFILLLMIFLHIVDDYYLQGCLSDLKQKDWWINNIKIKSDHHKYKNDYIMALLVHGFSWSFMIMLPIFYIHNFNNIDVEGVLIVNMLIHSYVDNLKANEGEINLIQDQLIHLAQIVVTWYFLVV